MPGESVDRRESLPSADERMIVLLDDSPESVRALEAAANLARRRHGVLTGVFVEELDLVRSAGFGFANEVGAMSGQVRQRAPERMDGVIRRRLRQVRLALEQMAAACGIEHELIVRRGRVVEEILALSGPGDLLIVGRVGWSRRLGRSFGSVPLALARTASGAVLIWTACPPQPQGRIAVLAENGSTLDSALAVAGERARLHRCGVSLLLPPGMKSEQVDAIQRRAAATFGPAEVPHEVRMLPATNPASLLHVLGQARAVELVLSRRGKLLSDPVGVRLLERIRLPVCVVP